MKANFKMISFILPALLTSLFSIHCFAEDGVTDDKVVFGQSASFKGASAALGSELWRGAHAYLSEINSQGGVHGRKIEILPLDDGYEGNVTLKNTIRLVAKKRTFGLFGYVGTPTIVKALPAIQKFAARDVFLFSNFTGAQPQREAPHVNNVFNIRSSYRQETARVVDFLVKNGIKKIGVFIQYDAYGRSGADGVQRALKKHGLSIVSEATYKRGSKYSVSMKQQVQILKEKGAEAVVSIGAYAGCAAFIRDARDLGFNGPIANVSFVGSGAMLSLLLDQEKSSKKAHFYTKNLINSQVVPPWSDTSIPIVKEYHELMDKHQPRVPPELLDPGYKPSKYSFVSLEGFVNAKMLVEVLKRAPKELTRKGFRRAAESIDNLDIGLGATRVGFSSTDHQASDDVFLTTVKNGEYVLIKGWKHFHAED